MHHFTPREKKISPIQFWLLLILSEKPNYGYQIIKRLKEMFKGYWEPKTGTIYPALEKLNKKSLISSRVEHREDTPNRRYFTLTEKGKNVLRENIKRWSKMIEHIEVYGETHRAIQRFRGPISSEALGRLLIEMGKGVKNGEFNLSEALPTFKPQLVKIKEPIKIKFLYARENEGLEIELEFKWETKDLKKTEKHKINEKKDEEKEKN